MRTGRAEVHELGRHGRQAEFTSSDSDQPRKQRAQTEEPHRRERATVQDAPKEGVPKEKGPMFAKTSLDAGALRSLVERAEKRAESKKLQSIPSPRLKRHICALGDQTLLEPGWLLRSMYAPERITLAQLLDASPRFRAQMIQELQKMEDPPNPRRRRNLAPSVVDTARKMAEVSSLEVQNHRH